MRARTDFVNGEIDDVRFYDSPLSAAVAAYIGNAGSSTVEHRDGHHRRDRVAGSLWRVHGGHQLRRRWRHL